MVNLTLRVLSKPDQETLPTIFKTLGLDYDERVLPSIGNEVLKAVVVRSWGVDLGVYRYLASISIRACWGGLDFRPSSTLTSCSQSDPM